jgi:hypothetical protein
MFDKQSGQWSHAAISRVAQERGYYPPDVEVALERYVEAPGHVALKALRAGTVLSPDQRDDLLVYVPVMLMRVPRKRRKGREAVPEVLESTMSRFRAEVAALRGPHAGTDWRDGIEQGIAESIAVLVALSPNSADSSYVTYEWAYALGSGKPIVPLRLAPCTVHPKLQVIQHLNSSNQAALLWDLLIERIREIERESEPAAAQASNVSAGGAQTQIKPLSTPSSITSGSVGIRWQVLTVFGGGSMSS